MKTRLINIVIALACFMAFGTTKAMAVDVVLTTDEGVVRPAAVSAAERNLGKVLTEINRAQKAKTVLTTNTLPMDDFSVKSLARIWAITPFYCDDEEIVERCWVFKDGTMMVSNIPLIITPMEEDFGMGTYQEAVVEFDAQGRITDFRLALDAHMGESFDNCGHVVDEEKKMIIRQYVERFRTAYNQQDIDYIEKMFSDDALIITGKVSFVRQDNSDLNIKTQKVEYTKQTKQQYIKNLKRAFMRNKWINVKFSEIPGYEDKIITRSHKNPNMYGVRLLQEWNSNNYSDKGYLFLLWEFPEDGSNPLIHVRTWQPESANGQHLEPDDEISTLGGFDL